MNGSKAVNWLEFRKRLVRETSPEKLSECMTFKSLLCKSMSGVPSLNTALSGTAHSPLSTQQYCSDVLTHSCLPCPQLSGISGLRLSVELVGTPCGGKGAPKARRRRSGRGYRGLKGGALDAELEHADFAGVEEPHAHRDGRARRPASAVDGHVLKCGILVMVNTTDREDIIRLSTAGREGYCGYTGCGDREFCGKRAAGIDVCRHGAATEDGLG